ncbi:MAG: TnpV protein [Oscillospiraceae bacterium]|nr:TnpV protein [Oscillospiraceae bacterium]
MEKHIYNEQTGISYTLHGDYYLPDLTLSDEEKGVEIGVWGQRHLRYIKQHRKVLYLNLLTSDKLNGYLADIDKQADEMFFRLVKQMAEREGVTEQLKADNQMEWVAWMNNIRSRVTEMINADLICT